MGGVDIDFQHAGIGGELEVIEPMIVRRLVTFEEDRQPQFRCRRLNAGDEIEKILQGTDRRQEDVQPAIARLDAKGGADDGVVRSSGLGRAAVQPAGPGRGVVPGVSRRLEDGLPPVGRQGAAGREGVQRKNGVPRPGRLPGE